MHSQLRALPVAFVLGIVSLIACSSDTSSSSESFKCCVNGAYYACSNSDDMSHCAKTDREEFCPRTSSRDAECK